MSSVAENLSGNSADELINEALDNLAVDSTGQGNQDSKDIFSGNSSGDSPSIAESIEEVLERTTDDGEIQAPWESCAGEMSQMEDCLERKCPGLWV